MSVLVIGSVALDTVKTPLEERADLLGGSASYAAVSASFFSPVNFVGIVGDDFPKAHLDLFRQRGINLDGLEIAKGKTFRWSGEYHWDLNTRTTRSVALNVFETFSPKLPPSYRRTPYVLLGNISPQLQLQVLAQMERPRLVVCDTMDLWINTAKDALMELLTKVDVVVVNDSEARELTKQTSLIKAGRQILNYGPAFALIKKGEHGCLMFGKDLFFSAPAYPLEDIHDPTGAGDSFAGGFTGYLAQVGDVSPHHLRRAVIFGSVAASYCVEDFSLERLKQLKKEDLDERFRVFKQMSQFEG
jgi:sugar/nucleoside kinase (ribokinase family)